jgi:hypothetical protein
MAWVKRWLVRMVLGGLLLVGLTHCAVVPLEPGYVAPPVVVVRPYHPYRYYAPFPYYGPPRPHGYWW